MDYSNSAMESNPGGRWNALSIVSTIIRVMLVLQVVVFALAAMMHAGVPLPLGFTEPGIVPAAVVEGAIAFFMAVGAWALFTERRWAWAAVVFAHAFAAGGILLGISALAFGRGPSSGANYIYHRVMLAVAAVILISLVTPIGRRALGYK